MDRDAIDDFLLDLFGADEPDYTDIGIDVLFIDDPEVLALIEQTLPIIDGKRVRAQR